MANMQPTAHPFTRVLAFSVLIYRRGKTRFFVDQPAAKETSVKGNAP